jgi:hypothetical protein
MINPDRAPASTSLQRGRQGLHRDPPAGGAKVPGSVAGWLRQVTLTAHTC